MGKQKRKWRRKHSPKHLKGGKHGSARLPRGRRIENTDRRVAPVEYEEAQRLDSGSSSIKEPGPASLGNRDRLLAETIYGLVIDCEFEGEKFNNVFKALSNRVGTGRGILDIGRIEDFYIPIKYVKPPNRKGVPAVRKSYGITLSPYHKSHYIIVLKDQTGIPGIMVCKDAENIVGAANYDSFVEESNYPDILYTPDTLEGLFNIPSIKPHKPSSNWGRLY